MLTSLWAAPPHPHPKTKPSPTFTLTAALTPTPTPNPEPKPRPYPIPRAALQVECSLKLGTLLAVTEPTFYDLYLRVDNEQLYPVRSNPNPDRDPNSDPNANPNANPNPNQVPVRLANLRVNGRRVNENSASITSQQNDQLVRRFFTVHAA